MKYLFQRIFLRIFFHKDFSFYFKLNGIKNLWILKTLVFTKGEINLNLINIIFKLIWLLKNN